MIYNINFENNFLISIKEYFYDAKLEKLAIVPFKYNNSNITFCDIIRIPQDAILNNDIDFVQINPKFLKRSINYCDNNNLSFGIIHNHLNRFNIFSPQDLQVEKILTRNIFKTSNIILISNLLYCNNTISIRIIAKSNEAISSINKYVIQV